MSPGREAALQAASAAARRARGFRLESPTTVSLALLSPAASLAPATSHDGRDVVPDLTDDLTTAPATTRACLQSPPGSSPLQHGQRVASAHTELASLEAMAELEEEALEIEAEVAKEAEAARRAAVSTALNALGKEQQFEALPMSQVRMAIEQRTVSPPSPCLLSSPCLPSSPCLLS